MYLHHGRPAEIRVRSVSTGDTHFGHKGSLIKATNLTLFRLSKGSGQGLTHHNANKAPPLFNASTCINSPQRSAERISLQRKKRAEVMGTGIAS